MSKDKDHGKPADKYGDRRMKEPAEVKPPSRSEFEFLASKAAIPVKSAKGKLRT